MAAAAPVQSKRPRRLKRWQIIMLVTILAGLVRFWAAWQLPPDADEPVYSAAGKAYADMVKAGNWQGVIDYERNREHPAFVKLVYSIPYLIYEPKFGSTHEVAFNRMVSVCFGTLAVLVLGLIDPLAGVFLAFDSMVIKYTSEVYLEAIPLFFSMLALFSMRRALQPASKNGWYWLSAIAIGIAGAGKYLYLLIGIPLLVMFFWNRKIRTIQLGIYLSLAGLAFFIFNPSLWIDPISRLWESLTFFANYTLSNDVLHANYPWYQVVNWISTPVPWHASVYFFPTTDSIIFIFLFLGILRETRQRAWVLIWMGATILILLLWPTKWPQYTLVLIPALCLVASTGVWVVVDRFREFDATWHWSEIMIPKPGKLFWIALTIILSVLLTGKLWNEFELAKAREGWIQVRAEFTPLPNNSINDIAFTPDGQVMIATNQGVANWKPDDRSPWGGFVKNYSISNSDLAHDIVRCLLKDGAGNWWFGTKNGLSVLTPNENWKTYRAEDLGMASAEIFTLAQDGMGQIWVGTKSGAGVLLSSGQWQTLTPQNSGLPAGSIFSIVVQSSSVGQTIWFATQTGVTSGSLLLKEWKTYDLSAYGIDWQGVSDLFVDQGGQVWAATLGDGVSKWDGKEWTTFRTSNSMIPGNSVSRILQTESGDYWFGFAHSTEPGGYLARFNKTEWMVFSGNNSGFSGGEPSAMVIDGEGRMWIGTKVDGISILKIINQQ